MSLCGGAPKRMGQPGRLLTIQSTGPNVSAMWPHANTFTFSCLSQKNRKHPNHELLSKSAKGCVLPVVCTWYIKPALTDEDGWINTYSRIMSVSVHLSMSMWMRWWLRGLHATLQLYNLQPYRQKCNISKITIHG